MENFNESLHQLGEKDLRMLFNNLLNTVDRYGKEGSIEEKKLGKKLVNMLSDHIDAVHNYQLQANGLQIYVHLVFSLSDAGSLKVTLRKIGKHEICQVIAFNDLFSVGPISDIDTTIGQQNRLFWMMEYDLDFRYGQHFNQESVLANVVKAVKSIPENKTIVIWCTDNAHDQTGLRFVLHLLRERKQLVNIVNLTELFNKTGLHNKEGVIPYFSGLIDREHFQLMATEYYEGIPLDFSQRRMYESEWLVLSEKNHVLRLWEENTVKGREESALDKVIIRSVVELKQEQDENGFIMAGSVVTRVFDTSHQFVGYSFVCYRIWILINQGILEFSGLPGDLHQFSVKLGTLR